MSETSARDARRFHFGWFEYLKCDRHVLPQPRFGKNQRVTKKKKTLNCSKMRAQITPSHHRPEKQLHVAEHGENRGGVAFCLPIAAKRLFC